MRAGTTTLCASILTIPTIRVWSDMVRLNWQYQIRSKKDLCVSAIVTLVPVDFEKSKL
jgi:hypothetical protein